MRNVNPHILLFILTSFNVFPTENDPQPVSYKLFWRYILGEALEERCEPVCV